MGPGPIQLGGELNGCIEDRATLYSSTEFKKVRLLYFTEDFKAWERAHS